MDWSGVDYCDVFIRLSFWRHPFTTEHPLLRHWCSDTFLMKKQTHPDLGWPENEHIFIMWTIPLTECLLPSALSFLSECTANNIFKCQGRQAKGCESNIFSYTSLRCTYNLSNVHPWKQTQNNPSSARSCPELNSLSRT